MTVTLSEWLIAASPAEVKPGQASFEISNTGARAHQFIVIKNDVPPGQLPTADVIVDESKVNVAGRTDTLAAGSEAQLSLDLTPGKYILICNLVDRSATGPPEPHYLNGMALGFIVLDR